MKAGGDRPRFASKLAGYTPEHVSQVTVQLYAVPITNDYKSDDPRRTDLPEKLLVEATAVNKALGKFAIAWGFAQAVDAVAPLGGNWAEAAEREQRLREEPELKQYIVEKKHGDEESETTSESEAEESGGRSSEADNGVQAEETESEEEEARWTPSPPRRWKTPNSEERAPEDDRAPSPQSRGSGAADHPSRDVSL